MEYKSLYNPQLNNLQGGLSKNLAHNNSENKPPRPTYWQVVTATGRAPRLQNNHHDEK